MPLFSVIRSANRVYFCDGPFDTCIKSYLFARKETLSAQIRSVSTSMVVRRGLALNQSQTVLGRSQLSSR